MVNSTIDGEDANTPPPTAEERQTETIQDDVSRKQEESEPDSRDDGPDVSARLDAIEKELAALKAMMDTLGFDDAAADREGAHDEQASESIEDLFD